MKQDEFLYLQYITFITHRISSFWEKVIVEKWIITTENKTILLLSPFF